MSRADEAHRLLSSEENAPSGDLYVLHPQVAPDEREATLARFAKSQDGILVCSGLAARGIDLPDIELVVEYQMAPNLVEHVHRLGRTARAGREGRAVSLVSESSANEAELRKEIERARKGGWKYL